MMRQKITHTDKSGYLKPAACVLAAMMTLLIAFPSFAASENDAAELQRSEENVITEEASGEKSGETEEQDDDEDAVPEERMEKAQEQSKKQPALKGSKGETVSYTARREGSNAGQTTIFTVINDGTTYTGTCAQQGVAMKPSGQATITKIANDTSIAKMIYHYAIELGDENWWSSEHKTEKVGKIIGMAHEDDTGITKRRMVEAFCQIYNMGMTSWYNTITSSSGGGLNPVTAKKIRSYYNNIDTSNVSVPDSFEIWLAKPGDGSQSFMMWAYSQPIGYGYVTMTKMSADNSITG